jgi:hypothetical protein
VETDFARNAGFLRELKRTIWLHAPLPHRVDVVVQEHPEEAQLLGVPGHLDHPLVRIGGSDVVSKLHN